MREVIINGQVYVVYENIPVPDQPKVNLLFNDMEKKEKKQREQGWKYKAVKGYRKK